MACGVERGIRQLPLPKLLSCRCSSHDTEVIQIRDTKGQIGGMFQTDDGYLSEREGVNQRYYNINATVLCVHIRGRYTKM